MPDHGLFQTPHPGCVAAGMDFARSDSAQPPFEHQFSFSKLGRTQHRSCVQFVTPEWIKASEITYVRLVKILTLSSSTALNASKYAINVLLTVRMLTKHSIVYPDPYDFHQASFTIRFHGYRPPNTVPLDDLNACYHQAKEIASAEVMEGQGEIPVGTNPQSWSSGNVYLRIEPGEQMTWHDWSSVLLFVRLFVYANQFKGTEFAIRRDGLGQIGTGFILRQPEGNSVATNTSVIVLPDPVPDPYDMQLQGMLIGMTIQFYGYDGLVSRAGLEGCVDVAYDDIRLHYDSGETTMMAPSFSYSVGGVNLYLRPEGNLTWGVWFNFPLRIQGFVIDNGLRETQFILLRDGFGQIGSGQLVSVAGASIDTA